MATTSYVAFYKVGGSNSWYSWDGPCESRSRAMQNIAGYERDEPGFRFVRLFESPDAVQQAIAYARANGLPLHPAIDVREYE